MLLSPRPVLVDACRASQADCGTAATGWQLANGKVIAPTGNGGLIDGGDGGDGAGGADALCLLGNQHFGKVRLLFCQWLCPFYCGFWPRYVQCSILKKLGGGIVVKRARDEESHELRS